MDCLKTKVELMEGLVISLKRFLRGINGKDYVNYLKQTSSKYTAYSDIQEHRTREANYQPVAIRAVSIGSHLKQR